MQSWLNAPRRKLPFCGRQGVEVTVVIVVRRNRVWVSIAPPCNSEIAILDPPQVDSLITTLTWAATEARGHAGS